MKKVSIALASSAALLFSAYSCAADYNNIYVFGDSLSDQGNLATVMPELQQPPYNSRFTNGKVAVEYLAEDMGLTLTPSLHLIGPEMGNNYSVAGAKAFGQEPVDLPYQVGAFVQNHNYYANPDNLYVLFIGGNDIRNARDNAENFIDGLTIAKTAAEVVGEQMELLASMGAKNFFVINTSDVSGIPESQLVTGGDKRALKKVSAYSKAYNLTLRKEVRQFVRYGSEELNVGFFNLSRAFNKELRKAKRDDSFTNTTDACFSMATGYPMVRPDCNFDSFVYFDDIHPTARMHAIFGEQLINAAPELEEYEEELPQ